MPTVIKADQLSAKGLPAPQPFNLKDIQAEAARLVSQAREQAQAILAEARRQAVRLREEAQAAGRREGYAAGLEEGRVAGREAAFREAVETFARTQGDLVQGLRAVIGEFEANKAALLLAARTDVLELAVAIARRVLKGACELPGVAGESAVRQAADVLELIGPRTDAVIRVNPADLEAMERFAAGLTRDVQEKRHVRLAADDTVAPGGCIVTTPEGRVDASIDTQLDRIAELLLGRGRRENP